MKGRGQHVSYLLCCTYKGHINAGTVPLKIPSFRSDMLRIVNIVLHHLYLRQAHWLTSHLHSPVESRFKVFIHKGGVCPLLQQHLGVLRPVVESCPVEWCHSLQNHNQRDRDEHRISGRKTEHTFSSGLRAPPDVLVAACQFIRSLGHSFNRYLLGFYLVPGKQVLRILQ